MKPHVLILEDNFLLAENLADIVQQDLKGEPMTVSTVTEALKMIPDGIEFAFLDIEVLDGNSYPAARKLMQNNIPFVFVSGNEKESLPREFRGLPFVSKPVSTAHLVQLSKALSNAFA